MVATRPYGMPSMHSFVAASAVGIDAVGNIRANAPAIRAKAMELTDAWAGVMFALSAEELETIAVALGFGHSVAEKIYSEIRALEYAHMQGIAGSASIATYHSLDVTFMALRGLTSYDDALASFGDHNLQVVLDAHQETFQRIRQALPEHAARMNFRPETAAAVLAAFGANVSPDLLYALAPKYGTTSVVDIEGRRGVTVEFIRCVSLTLASTL
jgi:hypothetical protein